MTSHYLDLTVVPDAETGAPQVLGALYDRLHLALVRLQLDTVGVSFPRYSLTPRAIGNVLRLHGDAETLRQLLVDDTLNSLRGHLRTTDVLPVPEGTPHRTVYRRQFKTSPERLRRRRMRRKGESAEQAACAIPDTVEAKPNLPYVHLRSRSTGQSYCLFIAVGAPQATATPGLFNSHGLGNPATIPWF